MAGYLINPLAAATLPGPQAIAQFAEMAIKMILAEQALVQFEMAAASSSSSAHESSVAAATADLWRGKIGPLSLKGRCWQTKKGLSCRALEVSVSSFELDMPAMVHRQKIVIRSHGAGRVVLALDARDVGNFLTHAKRRPPLPVVRSVGERPQIVLKKKQRQQQDCGHDDSIVIDSRRGTMEFSVKCAGRTFGCTLKPSGEKICVSVVPCPSSTNDDDDARHKISTDELAAELSDSLTKFCNEFRAEVNGTWLSFRDMIIVASSKGTSEQASVMVAVDILPRSRAPIV